MSGGRGVTTDGVDEDVGKRAREGGVPLGGTAEFLMWLRVGTVVPFVSFLCGDSNGLRARKPSRQSGTGLHTQRLECLHGYFASAGGGPKFGYGTSKILVVNSF
jgi:hypothetical protein